MPSFNTLFHKSTVSFGKMYRFEIWDARTRKMTFEFDDFESLSCYSHPKRFLAIHRSVFSPHRLMFIHRIEKRTLDFLQMSPLVFPTRNTVLKWHLNEYKSRWIFPLTELHSISNCLTSICIHLYVAPIMQRPTNLVHTHYREDSPKVFCLCCIWDSL